MRTKKILKKDAAKFCKDANTLTLSLGFQDLPSGQLGNRRIQTDCGIYVVHLPTMNCWYPSPLISLNGYFEEASRAAARVDCNPYSGKFNFLGSDPNKVLQSFAHWMRLIHAHAPTPDELVAWEQGDAEKAKKLAVWRGEIDKILTP